MAGETIWVDGPLTRAVREGAICYLDEVVEARQDTTVVIHALTDHRRVLPLDKKGELLHAHPDFQLVIPPEDNDNPPSYRTKAPGKYALEVPQGWFQKNRIVPGMKFSFLDPSDWLE